MLKQGGTIQEKNLQNFQCYYFQMYVKRANRSAMQS